jgi:hypothetical protein
MNKWIRFLDAHGHSARHRRKILASDICGCFYCRQIFAASEITNWVDQNETALCPKCGIDSVIGSAALTKEFLHEMHERWF